MSDSLSQPFLEGLPGSRALHPRALAHLGDAVYELFIRELALKTLGDVSSDELHKFTTDRAKASYQVELLKQLEPELNEDELALVKRARNTAVTTSRRKDQALHRQATAFEALIGYWYLEAPERLRLIKL